MHRIIDIQRKTDERGWLAEIIKAKDLPSPEFGQFFITTAKPGIVKGNHYHTRKHEYFCVMRGKAILTLEELDKKSKKVMKSEDVELDSERLQLVEILPWTNHLIKNTGDSEMWLLVYVSEEFDAKDPDTFRL